MAAKRQTAAPEEQLSLYELFIGLMTIFSLVVMAAQFLLREYEVWYQVLFIVDNLFCVIFLTDFAGRLIRAESKIGYLKWQGTFDLLGSIPAVPALRLFRLFRLTRIARILRIGGPSRIVHEFMHRRSESALYLTIIMALLVITFGSIGVYAAETFSPDPNITSGQDAVWWSIVTITTVGYGDEYPTTWPGRLIGMMTMITGIGIFGVFTSFLANAFMSAPKSSNGQEAMDDAESVQSDTAEPPSVSALESQIARLSHEIEELKVMLANQARPAS